MFALCHIMSDSITTVQYIVGLCVMFHLLADQTPTPTKFLRNCEEIGLFHELAKNPFEEAFKKAAEDSKNLDLQEVSS